MMDYDAAGRFILDARERRLRFALGVLPVTLYDQFGRPVYVESTAAKIGNTISVKRPGRFTGGVDNWSESRRKGGPQRVDQNNRPLNPMP